MEAPSTIAGETVELHPSPQSSDRLRPDLIRSIWRTLLHPATLIAVALTALFLVLAALLLPQMPDQLHDEPAASARWLLTTATAYGPFGQLMRGLGLFDVLHSVLFRMALALLTLILAVHLADAIGVALAYLRIRRVYCVTQTDEHEPLVFAMNMTVHRLRFAASSTPSETQEIVDEAMDRLYDNVVHCVSDVANEHDIKPDIQPVSPDDALTKSRSFATRNPVSFLLRPLLPLGLLGALTVVWLFLLVGWELHTPTLAPGGSYRATSRDLLVQYDVPAATTYVPGSAEISIQLNQQIVTSPVSSDIHARLGASRLTGQRTTPGLLVRIADGRRLLTEPGQSDTTDRVGVILPSPGSEESLLIPDLSLGLRILRRTDDPSAFIVELYRGADLLPSQRFEITGPTQISTGSGEDSLEIEILPLPGIDVTVRHMPGQWILWIAAILSLAGFIGVVRSPSLTASQIEPWPNMRTLVILQAIQNDDLEAIVDAIEASGVDTG